MTKIQVMVYGAVITMLSLVGGGMLGLVAGSIVFNLIPGHNLQPVDPVDALVAAIPALAGFFAGGAAWGLLIGRLAHAPDPRRMAIAGALGFAPVTIAMALVLQVVEPIALERFGATIPLHRLFTLLFVPTAFLITGISAYAIGVGLRDKAMARSFPWRVGLAAAIAFLVVNLTMESAGWVVGAPGAAERFTMLTVMFAGNLGAAVAGGAVIGSHVARLSRIGFEATIST